MRIFAGIQRGQGRQTTVGLSTTAIFGDCGGYFFGHFRPVLLWRYAISCRLEIYSI